MPSSETPHILRSVILGGMALRFRRAVLVIESGGDECLSRWIAIYDADPRDFRRVENPVGVSALTRDRTRLAGRVVLDGLTAACRFVGLRGVGALLVG